MTKDFMVAAGPVAGLIFGLLVGRPEATKSVLTRPSDYGYLAATLIALAATPIIALSYVGGGHPVAPLGAVEIVGIVWGSMFAVAPLLLDLGKELVPTFGEIKVLAGALAALSVPLLAALAYLITQVPWWLAVGVMPVAVVKTVLDKRYRARRAARASAVTHAPSDSA
jgi:hypothetical protein